MMLQVNNVLTFLFLSSLVLWKKFYVWNAERTNGAHFEIVQKFKNIGHTEVDSPEDCHYLLGFCPVASRVGTDISEALHNKPRKKR